MEVEPRRAIQTGMTMLLLLTLVHALVDAFASSVQPLWPDLEIRLKLGPGTIQWIFVVWSVATSVSQFAFGYLGDRYSGRWLLWAGPALGVIGMGCVGLAGSLWSLGALVMLGGLGVAAFHPEAAATAGSVVPEARSRAMSIFATGGFLGQALGPLGSGLISERWGLSALAWNLVWGLLLLAMLRPQRLGQVPAIASSAARTRVSLSWLLRIRRREIATLLYAGVLRVIPAGGTPLALAFWLNEKGAGNDVIGLNQSAFFLGIGLGGLACAFVTHRMKERRLLWTLPLLSAPMLLIIPTVPAAAVLVCSFLVGGLVGLGLPVFISYGQQLMPEGQRVASSLTMGVSWGLGGIVVAGVMALCTRWNHPEWPFFLFALVAVIAGLVCLRLPAARPLKVPEASNLDRTIPTTIIAK